MSDPSTSKQRPAPEKGLSQVGFAGGAMALILTMVGILLFVILRNGLGYFWVNDVETLTYTEPGTTNTVTYLGEVAGYKRGELTDTNGVVIGSFRKTRFKLGNREFYPEDFVELTDSGISAREKPEDIYVLERMKHGNLYAFYQGEDLDAEIAEINEARKPLTVLADTLSDNSEKQKTMRDRFKKASYYAKQAKGAKRDQLQKNADEAKVEIDKLQTAIDADFNTFIALEGELRAKTTEFKDVNGQVFTVPLVDIVRPYQPNNLSAGGKMKVFFSKAWEVISTKPRNGNEDGGIFPAIYGTVLMVFLMSLFVMPFGVIAAIYLREYAKEGTLVRLVRIAVNNLAGVPSIVYGIFGLGFFAYTCGHYLDETFYAWKDHETFNGGGILWASLTLAVLTVPVVIVATEEALASIPRGVREGSYALGATKFQTVKRVLFPMALPGILTGLILAIARAAGEVAPLMLTGAVDHTDAQPFLGSESPHLHQKFMHLGYSIYYYGFRSSNAEATRPMLFVTTLVLLLLVIGMNILAIMVRNRMRKKFSGGAF